MSNSEIAFVAVIVLAFIYVGLAVAAFAHIRADKRKAEMNRLLAFTFWWPFYDIYDDAGTKIARLGQIVFPLAILANGLWIVL